ncbi:MAG: integrin alpha, partial [Planctomycetota bacterium]
MGGAYHALLAQVLCVCVCVATILVARARAQTENIFSMDPAAGERFGSAVAAAPLVGGIDWVIGGVPLAQVDGLAEAGEVECHPAIQSPTTPPFKLKAPVGHVQEGAHFGSALAAADIDGDGTIDIVVGAPGQDVGLRQSHGRVIIYYGPWNPTAQQPWSARTILDVYPFDSHPTNPLHGDEFGYGVAIGDLDHWGFLDVVVGAPRADYVLIQPA